MHGLAFDLSLVGFGAFILLICFLCCCRLWRLRTCERRETGCKSVKYSKNTKCCNDNCSVCLEEFESKESITVCPCNHGFHKKCLSAWLSQHNTCPMCKAEVRRYGERSHLIDT